MLQFDPRNLDDLLLLQPKGVFEIQTVSGHPQIVIHRFGEPDEIIVCASLGHANQMRQALSDEGMIGLVEGAR